MLGYRSRPFSALLEALGEVQVDIFEVTLFASRVKIGLKTFFLLQERKPWKHSWRGERYEIVSQFLETLLKGSFKMPFLTKITFVFYLRSVP